MSSGSAVAPLTHRAPSAWAGDLWGGMASMLVAFPSAIAFGVVIFSAVSPSLASAGALAGIIGAAALGIVAPLIGRNAGLITAPSAPAAAVMTGVATTLAAQGDTPARILAILALTALVSASLQIVYGAVRAGRLIKFIPYQVVNGYLSGVAVIIAVAQVPRLLGVPPRTTLMAAMDPRLWSWPGIVVGVVTILAMVLSGRITRSLPAAVVGLAGGVASYFLLAAVFPELRVLSGNPLVVGRIQAGGPLLEMVSARAGSLLNLWRELPVVIGPALTLSVLLSIDTLKTGVVLDALTRRRHNSNRELTGQGIANLVSFAAGGIPGSGTMGPTLVNVSSGARTIRSSILEGILCLLAFLALGNLVAWVPVAALAGILLVIAWRMFTFDMFRLLRHRSTRLDFLVIATVIVVAEAVGLIQASLAGVFLAILLFIRNQIRASVVLRKTDLREMRSKRRRSPEENEILDERGGEALIVQLKDDLFFGTTDQLFTELEEDLKTRRFVLLDFRRVQSMDYTAAHLLEQMHERLHENNGDLLFCGLPSQLPTKQNIERYMASLGVVRSEQGVEIFDTRDSALEWMEEAILASAGFQHPDTDLRVGLEEMTILDELDPKAIAALQKAVREVSVGAGERIFSAGDGGDEIFFVSRGRVHVLLPLEGGKRHHLATIGAGDFFGEMSFLDRRYRSADAEAASVTDLFVLSRESFDAVAREAPSVGQSLFEELAFAISERLRAADAELRALEER